MTGLGRHSLVPRTVHGRVDASALAVTRHPPLLPMCGLIAPGCGLLTATVIDGYARALGRDDCTRD